MAKTVVIFDSAKLALMTGGMNLSDTYRCALLSAGWTPSIDISDIANSISSFMHTKGSNGLADRVVNPPAGGSLGDQFTKTADGVLKFDLSDVAFTASSGENLCAQYGVVIGNFLALRWSPVRLTSNGPQQVSGKQAITPRKGSS